MRKLFLAFAALFLFEAVKAQFTENFADGDFTANPAWGGSTSDYIVNASFQLQSNNLRSHDGCSNVGRLLFAAFGLV